MQNSNRGYSCECHIGLNFEGEGETCTRIGFDNVMWSEIQNGAYNLCS